MTPLPKPTPELTQPWVDGVCQRLTATVSTLLCDQHPEWKGMKWAHLSSDHPAQVDLRVLKSAAQIIRSGSNKINHLEFTQALFDTYLLERWYQHPNIADVTGNLAEPGEFRSGIPVLAAASMLADYGNGVTLVARYVGRGQTPDLCAYAAPMEKFYVEVKTPTSLNMPERAIPLPIAQGAIANYVSKVTNSRDSGQVSQRYPGFLGIVGFGMTDESGRNLERAAEIWLSSHSIPKGLYGILIFNMGSLLDMRRTPKDPTVLPEGKQVRGTVELRHAFGADLPSDLHVALDKRRDLPPEA
jgi:hypothetical protein